MNFSILLRTPEFRRASLCLVLLIGLADADADADAHPSFLSPDKRIIIIIIIITMLAQREREFKVGAKGGGEVRGLTPPKNGGCGGRRDDGVPLLLTVPYSPNCQSSLSLFFLSCAATASNLPQSILHLHYMYPPSFLLLIFYPFLPFKF